MKDALALVNSLEQRIEALSEENERILTALANYDRQTELRIFENYYTVEAYEELREEYERLRACTNLIPSLYEVKADTVREMQERVKANFKKYGRANWSVRAIIDEAANEVLEDLKNERKN